MNQINKKTNEAIVGINFNAVNNIDQNMILSELKPKLKDNTNIKIVPVQTKNKSEKEVSFNIQRKLQSQNEAIDK